MSSSQDHWQDVDNRIATLKTENYKLRAILSGMGVHQESLDQILETPIDNCRSFGTIERLTATRAAVRTTGGE